MEFQPVTTARARALAIQLRSGTTDLGGGLDLTISPEALASNRAVLPAFQPIGSVATAQGLGLGSSRFLASPADLAFFGNPLLTVISGGGSINGAANASASTTGRNDNSAKATAVNIALANLDLFSRGSGVLQIGTLDKPFSAEAITASRSLLSPQASPILPARLDALATVRGLEGSPAAPVLASDAADAWPAVPAPLPTFFGQPNAVVAATAHLDADPGPAATAASAQADARGIEGYRVMALAPDQRATPARVSGIATATLIMDRAPAWLAQPLDLAATAIGIDTATMTAPARAGLVIQASALARLQAPTALSSGSVNLQSLKGIGISGSDIQGNGAGTTVVGIGGFVAPVGLGVLPTMDAAGIDRSTILTGSGGDVVIGRIATEADAGLDGNGDSVISPMMFLDASALSATPGGYDGIRSSVIDTGAGEDLVGVSRREELPAPGSSARDSRIETGSGNDVIRLDRARMSSLDGGFGDDKVKVVNQGFGNRLQGGFGNDELNVGDGDSNILDGGFGQDLVVAGGAANIFLQSDSGAALDAATHFNTKAGTFAERLTMPAFWNSLPQEQKQGLWDSGTLQDGGKTLRVDTFKGFDPMRGDILDLSSSLGSLTQQLWDNEGALFGVEGGNLVVREGPQDSQLGVVVASLEDIHKLGIGSPSLAYATDTRQLMFDADGDWKNGGSQSIGTLSMADPAQLSKANLHFGSGS